MTTPALSITREILRVYDQRFLEVEGPVRRQVVTATKGMLAGLITERERLKLAERDRLRAFCIEHELFEELERLIADELAGRKEGAVVVGGRVYAVYPYLRGVPRQDADITNEVDVEHQLTALSWEKAGLKIKGRAVIARIQQKDPVIKLILTDGDREGHIPVTMTEHGFEAVLERPGPGSWTVEVEVATLGLTRRSAFGEHRADAFKDPKPKDGVEMSVTGQLKIDVVGAEVPQQRRFWQLRRARQR